MTKQSFTFRKIEKPEELLGLKDDKGKPRVELVDPDFILELARVLMVGALKYGFENWKQGFNLDRLYGAALRHMLAWKQGEIFDSETGLPHTAHAAVNLMFIEWYDKKALTENSRQNINCSNCTHNPDDINDDNCQDCSRLPRDDNYTSKHVIKKAVSV